MGRQASSLERRWSSMAATRGAAKHDAERRAGSARRRRPCLRRRKTASGLLRVQRAGEGWRCRLPWLPLGNIGQPRPAATENVLRPGVRGKLLYAAAASRPQLTWLSSAADARLLLPAEASVCARTFYCVRVKGRCCCRQAPKCAVATERLAE
jgi:hypothetical protein